MKFKSLFSLVLLLFTQPLWAQSQIQQLRFDGPLRILESGVENYDGSQQSLDAVAERMLRGLRRVAAFKLQALGKIYQKYPVENSEAFFKMTLRFSAKSLEDAIGGYDKWDDILENLKKEKASEEKIATAEHNKKMAYDVLLYVLSGKKTESLASEVQWTEETRHFLETFEGGKSQSLFKDLQWVGTSPTLIQAIRDQLETWPWLSPQEDRTYVLKRLRNHLKDLDKTEFNFGLLEDTASEKGLHEFRREVRWFSFQAGVLNGTINFYDTFMTSQVPQCPSAELAPLTDAEQYPGLAKSSYSKLPDTPFAMENVCGISRCLYYKLTKIVSDIGEIKDSVEQGNFLHDQGNTTPEWAIEGAEEIYQDMKDTQVIDHLRDQIKACYDN